MYEFWQAEEQRKAIEIILWSEQDKLEDMQTDSCHVARVKTCSHGWR